MAKKKYKEMKTSLTIIPVAAATLLLLTPGVMSTRNVSSYPNGPTETPPLILRDSPTMHAIPISPPVQRVHGLGGVEQIGLRSEERMVFAVAGRRNPSPPVGQLVDGVIGLGSGGTLGLAQSERALLSSPVETIASTESSSMAEEARKREGAIALPEMTSLGQSKPR